MKTCPKCGASNDDATSFCVSCGASFDSPEGKPSESIMSSLKTWLIIDGVFLAALVCLDILLPYPAQAYIVLASAVGFIAMLVLLIASLVAGWKKHPFLLGLAVFLILPAVAYLAFPKAELKSDSIAVYSILVTSESPEPAPSPSSSMSLSVPPSPSPSPLPSQAPLPTSGASPATAPTASPSPAPTPSQAPSSAPSAEPVSSPEPSASPAVSPAPSAEPSSQPSPEPSPEQAPAPSPSPSAEPVPAPSSVPSASPAASVIQVSAWTLTTRYSENELAADRDYKDKLLQVSGVFQSLSVESGLIQVLIGDGSSWNTSYICCYFDSAYADELIDLRTGDRMVVQGLCGGKYDMVRLDQCMPVE